MTAAAGAPRAREPWRLYATRRTRLVVTAICLLISLYIILPLLWLLIAASKTDSEMLNSFGLSPAGPFRLFTNIANAFGYDNGIYGHWFVNTIIYSVAAGAGAAITCSIGGYAFARYRFVGRRALFGLVIASVAVPGTVLVIPLYLLFSDFNLLDTAWGFVLPSIVSPVGIYLMRVYADSAVPWALIDAARVDGASEVRIFRSVVARLISPGAATVFLFSVVGTWNNYFLPLLLFSTSNKMPVTVGLGILQQNAAMGNTGSQSVYTMVIAGSLIAIVPLIAVFLVMQRYWRRGLTLGAVTG